MLQAVESSAENQPVVTRERSSTTSRDLMTSAIPPSILPEVSDVKAINILFEAFMDANGFKDQPKKNMRVLGNAQKLELLKADQEKKRKEEGLDSPKAAANQLHQKLVTTQHLQTLRMKLSSKSSDWLSEFLACRGLEFLTHHLPESPQYIVLPQDIDHCMEILRCIKAIMNNSQGLNHVVQDPDNVSKLILVLMAPKDNIRSQAMELLTVIFITIDDTNKATYSELVNAVLSGVRNLMDILSQSKQGNLLKHSLSFINSFILSASGFDQRQMLRKQFLHHKIIDRFQLLRDKLNRGVIRVDTESEHGTHLCRA
jgi:hypothetical protein